MSQANQDHIQSKLVPPTYEKYAELIQNDSTFRDNVANYLFDAFIDNFEAEHTEDGNMFDVYNISNIIYFLIDKKRKTKYAVLKDLETHKIQEIRDAEDRLMIKLPSDFPKEAISLLHIERFNTFNILYTTLTESFKDALNKWQQEPSVLIQDINNAIMEFKELRKRGLIKTPYNDIGYWIKKPFNEFAKYIKDIQSQPNLSNRAIKKQLKLEGADLIYDSPEWAVYLIKTTDASILYGKNTKWCISADLPPVDIEEPSDKCWNYIRSIINDPQETWEYIK